MGQALVLTRKVYMDFSLAQPVHSGLKVLPAARHHLNHGPPPPLARAVLKGDLLPILPGVALAVLGVPPTVVILQSGGGELSLLPEGRQW